ncbi:MAG: hypothetical protein AAGJ38_08895 [Planctomycetota bacterium]
MNQDELSRCSPKLHSWLRKHEGLRLDKEFDFIDQYGSSYTSHLRAIDNICDMYSHDEDDASQMLAIASDDLGNHVCVDVNDDSVFFWDHEENVFIQFCVDISLFMDMLRERKLSPIDQIFRSGNLSNLCAYFNAKAPNTIARIRLDDQYDRLLMECVSIKGNIPLVREMVGAGFSVGTSLDIAAKNNHLALAEFLIASGADPKSVDLKFPKAFGYVEMVKLIENAISSS